MADSKRSYPFIIFLYIIPHIFLIIVILTGHGLGQQSNKKADDEISKAIYEAVGKKVYYQYKETDSEKNSIEYHYLIHDYEDENLLMDIADVVNEKIKELKIMKKYICGLRKRYREDRNRWHVCIITMKMSIELNGTRLFKAWKSGEQIYPTREMTAPTIKLQPT